MHTAEIHRIFVLVAYGPMALSVLIWRHCDTLCTSGFVYDVTFSRNGMARRVLLIKHKSLLTAEI